MEHIKTIMAFIICIPLFIGTMLSRVLHDIVSNSGNICHLLSFSWHYGNKKAVLLIIGILALVISVAIEKYVEFTFWLRYDVFPQFFLQYYSFNQTLFSAIIIFVVLLFIIIPYYTMQKDLENKDQDLD